MELPVPQGQNNPQGVPEDEDQVVPQNVPEDEDQVVPQNVPEDEDQVVPEIEPPVGPDVEPQVGPDVEPQVGPEIEPEYEPYVEIIRDERTEDEWDKLFKKGKFKKEDMNMMVMDFLLAHALHPAAQTFHKESGCPIPMDSEGLALVEIQKIVKDYIMNRQFDDAIHALNEILTPAFLEARPRVHFLLEQQKMIELCRAREKVTEALSFSREFIRWESVQLRDDSFKEECRSTMLLLISGDNKSSPASGLLDDNRMISISQYVADNLKTYNDCPTGSHIEIAMKMVIHEDNELNKEVLHPCFEFDTGYPKLFYQ